MKNVVALLAAIFTAFFAGGSASDPGVTPDPSAMRMGIGASSSLMKVLKSPPAQMLSGWKGPDGCCGASIIFVQSRDGETTVSSPEALDTVYILSAQPGGDFGQTIEFEADKTNKELYLLRYQLVDAPWLETSRYNPAALPDIDFQKIYRNVKNEAGKDIKIASIAVFYPLFPEGNLVVSFQVLREEAEYCEQWQYHVFSGELDQTAQETRCFFEMRTAYDVEDGEEYPLSDYIIIQP